MISQTLENRQELEQKMSHKQQCIHVQELLKDRFECLRELCDRFGFSMVVGTSNSKRIVVGPHNVHFLHPSL